MSVTMSRVARVVLFVSASSKTAYAQKLAIAKNVRR